MFWAGQPFGFPLVTYSREVAVVESSGQSHRKQLWKAVQLVIDQLRAIDEELGKETVFRQHHIYDLISSIGDSRASFELATSLAMKHSQGEVLDTARVLVRYLGEFHRFSTLVAEKIPFQADATVFARQKLEIRERLIETLKKFIAAYVSLRNTSEQSFKTGSTPEVSPPAIVVSWNPELVSAEDYVELMNAIGDLVRCSGGLGVKLLRSEAKGVECSQEVLL